LTKTEENTKKQHSKARQWTEKS